MRLAVVANPGSRRLALFAAAVRAAGLPAPRVVAWADVVGGGRPPVFDRDELVRIESPGEDAEVTRLLRGAPVPAEHGRIVGLGEWYRGFERALGRIAGAVDGAGARLLNDPGEILTMGDKRACHAVLAAAGVAVPPALPPVRGYGELRAAMAAAGWARVFVKPAYGSSASGVLALAAAGGRVGATTSVELEPGDGGRLFNSLTVRRYSDEHAIATIVDTLAPDGLHVERWFPKASLDGRVVDLRVVVIAGEPSHVVVRASHHPMTNLHLGGGRGDLERLRERAGGHFDRALATCAAVARCFPGSLHVGVDLMFSPDWRRHAVAEVNAFGDLLPGLLVRGRDTYAAELAALTAAPADARVLA